MWTTSKIVICVISIALVGGLKLRERTLSKKEGEYHASKLIDIDTKISQLEEDKKNTYIRS